MSQTEIKTAISFNFANIDPDLLMIATIQAANGVTDNLYNIFKREIK